MRVLHEKSPGDMSPSELKKLRDQAVQRDVKDKAREAAKEKSNLYYKELRKTRKYKVKRLKWQMQQSKDKEQRRKEQQAKQFDPYGKGEVITSKDADPTATKKAISNVASVVGGLARIGGKVIAGRMQRKKEAREAGQKKAGERSSETKAAMKQKLLPPGRSSEFEKTDKTSQRQPGTSRPSVPIVRPFTTGQRVRTSKRILPLGVNKASESPISKRPSSGLSNPNAPRVDTTPRPNSLGQKARSNPKLKQKLIKARMEQYEYSCWREEFLYELGELRQKVKKNKDIDKDPVIDIMKGTNKITMNPTVSESTESHQDQFDRRVAAASKLSGSAKIKMLKYAASKHPKVNEELNTAAYMAKATPAITGRTKVISDIHLSKQPGKGTAEMVRDRMRKLFSGDLKNYNPNYDFNGNTSDDNDVISNKAIKSESYDENDETFRQHSRERFTSDSGDESRKKRTSAVLKAIAALNKDVDSKAKKKKKKE